MAVQNSWHKSITIMQFSQKSTITGSTPLSWISWLKLGRK